MARCCSCGMVVIAEFSPVSFGCCDSDKLFVPAFGDKNRETHRPRPTRVALLDSGLCNQPNVAEQNRARIGGHHIRQFH